MKRANSRIDADGDAVELDDAFFPKAQRGRPALHPSQRKQRLNVMLDPDVADRLRSDGDISARINNVMRKELGLPG